MIAERTRGDAGSVFDPKHVEAGHGEHANSSARATGQAVDEGDHSGDGT